MEKNYFDPSHPASFKGPNKLHQVVVKEGKHKISLSQIRKWLQDQESYRLMKPMRRKIKRMRVIVTGLHDQYDAGLADFIGYSNANDGIRYLLVIIDVKGQTEIVLENPYQTAVPTRYIIGMVSSDAYSRHKSKFLSNFNTMTYPEQDFILMMNL